MYHSKCDPYFKYAILYHKGVKNLGDYKYIFSEGRIGNFTTRNRIVMSAMDAVLADMDGTPNEDVIAYYVARAKGGVGLIINGLTRVDNDLGGIQSLRSLALTSDDQIPAFKALTDAVHAEGAKMVCQLHHPGRETVTALNGGKDVVSASAVPCGFLQQPTRALTVDEIHELEEKFISAAARAKEAGYDAVELHAAHGYLLQQFLSPHTNKRDDEYGGSMENRMRMTAEIIEGIHQRCGDDYPILVRISADEFLALAGIPDKGLDLEETVTMCVELEKLGVAAIDVSGALYETANCAIEPTSFPEGWRIHLMKAVKDAVTIPVMGVSTIRHPEFAEKLLAEGNQDFISMGRTFLAEPEWVNKVKEGREKELRLCIQCLHCFETYMGVMGTGDRIECALCPQTAHELQYKDLKKDGDGRLVVVVGAGPAGMQAAKTLSERGFKVRLFEKASVAGGQVNLADKPPMKMRLDEFMETQLEELRLAGIEVEYDHEATAEEIKSLDPYAVFLATGCVPIMPASIPGIDNDNVFSYEEVMSGAATPQGRRVVVVGGGNVGLDAAHMLTARYYEVSVVEMQPAIGPDMYVQNILDLSGALAAANAAIYVDHKVTGFEGNVLHTIDVSKDQPEDIEGDTFVVALGARPYDPLQEELKTLGVKNVKAIGDAAGRGRVAHAVRGGFDAAFNL